MLVAGMAAFVIITKLVVEDLLGVNIIPTVQAWMADPGPGAALLVVVLLAVDLFIPVPSSVVMVLSGVVFGTWRGAALSFAGSLACSVIGFELARRHGRGLAARLVGDHELARLERAFARYGGGIVFVTRVLPVMKETLSVIAGLSRMDRRAFLVATIAGSVPEALIYAYAGAASREAGSLVPAFVILVALSGIGWMIARRQLT
jgi:uncharacterized membrane protein YdjX (TVP38/TMEM64 family)